MSVPCDKTYLLIPSSRSRSQFSKNGRCRGIGVSRTYLVISYFSMKDLSHCLLFQSSVASELWHRYEALTSSLSQDLCEQLRLVLEPTQATKLR